MNLSADLRSGSVFSGGDDYLWFYYKIDDSPKVKLTNGDQSRRFDPVTATATGLRGRTIQFSATAYNTRRQEIHYIDNISVTGFASQETNSNIADLFTFNWVQYNDYLGINTYQETGARRSDLGSTVDRQRYQVVASYRPNNCISNPEEIHIQRVPSILRIVEIPTDRSLPSSKEANQMPVIRFNGITDQTKKPLRILREMVMRGPPITDFKRANIQLRYRIIEQTASLVLKR